MDNRLTQRFLEAVQLLMTEYPFYTPVLDRIRFYSGNTRHKTMAIDSNLVIYVNEDFANSLNDIELKNIILHEILHYSNGHHQRFFDNPYKDHVPHSIHNIAMDLEVNELVPRGFTVNNQILFLQDKGLLTQDELKKIGEINSYHYDGILSADEYEAKIYEIIESKCLPDSVFRATDFGLPKDRSYEEYLGILHNNMPEELKALMESLMSQGDDDKQKDQENDKDKESASFPFDDIDIENYSDINKELLIDLLDECEEKERERQEHRARGYEYDSEEIVRTVGKKKYSWDVVFRNILSSKVTDIIAGFKYRTYLKPNRRYFSDDIIFSAYIDYESKINVAILMDISGSMGYMVDEMYSVLKSIVDIQDLKINCTILEVTDTVQKVIHNFDFNARQFESKDGGGNDMPAAWKYLIDNNMADNMDLIVCMTDMQVEWEPILVEKSVVLGNIPVKPDDCPYTYFPVIFPEPKYDWGDYDYDDL